MADKFPGEPYVQVGGIRVHQGAVWMLESLRETAHRITIEDGALAVEPNDLPAGGQALLEAFTEDLIALITLDANATVH